MKEGRVNERLLGIIGENEKSKAEPNLEQIEQSLGPKGVSQIRRMLRQRQREAAIEDFRTRDTGMDPKTREVVQLSPKPIEVSDYFDPLKEAYAAVKDSGPVHFCLTVVCA